MINEKEVFNTSDKLDRQAIIDGAVLLINKPLNWSSFDVIRNIKYTLKDLLRKEKLSLSKIKVGHAGTLDPMATGLLLVCTGKKTKIIPKFQDLTKVYAGKMIIGKTTYSFDSETPFNSIKDFKHITKDDILSTREIFTGEITQVPPIYSAIKVNGKRLYKEARKNIEVEIPKRIVYIYDFKLTKIDLPNIEFIIHCSKGTYIRSIANDFGNVLGTGAYLSALKRIKIGNYNIDDAFEIENLRKDLLDY